MLCGLNSYVAGRYSSTTKKGCRYCVARMGCAFFWKQFLARLDESVLAFHFQLDFNIAVGRFN